MKKVMVTCFVIFLLANSLMADQSSKIKKLEVRIVEFEKRVAKLEALLDSSTKDEIIYSDKSEKFSYYGVKMMVLYKFGG